LIRNELQTTYNINFQYKTTNENITNNPYIKFNKNAIILWNYLFISEKLSQITHHAELQKQINLLKNSSMMTWQHVNLHGKYDFDIDVNTTPFDLNVVKTLNINWI